MKTNHIVFLIVGASLATFFLSVIFSINMVSINSKDLAQVIKNDPETFVEATRDAVENFQKQSAKKALEKRMKNPEKLATKGRVTFGDPKAAITIVEYSDFQCPYCARASKHVKGLVKKYKGKVSVVYKHFPLSFHPFAQPAAEYFEAIALIDHEQAKKFHDAIFDNFEDYASLKEEAKIHKSLQALVTKLKFDLKKVKSNMDKAKAIVQEDMAEAEKIKVRGTPSFYVNGVDSGGDLEGTINNVLKEMEKKSPPL